MRQRLSQIRKRNCLYNVSCFGSRPKNFGPAIRLPPPLPGQELRGGMATTWLADRFSENLEARTRLQKGTCFCAGRRSGPEANRACWSPQELPAETGGPGCEKNRKLKTKVKPVDNTS